MNVLASVVEEFLFRGDVVDCVEGRAGVASWTMSVVSRRLKKVNTIKMLKMGMVCGRCINLIQINSLSS